MAPRNTILTAAFLAAAVLMFAGLALPHPYGGMILLVLAAALALLLVRTWPAHGTRARALRVVVLAALVALAAARLV